MVTHADLRAVLKLSELPPHQRTSRVAEETLSSDFVREHPALVNMLASPRLNVELLRTVLARFETVLEGKESEHDASVAVGQDIFDSYAPKFPSK